MRFTAAVVADAAVSALLVLVLFTIATGGGVYDIHGIRLSVRSVDNPLLLTAVILAGRLGLAGDQPFLGSPRAQWHGLAARVRALLDRMGGTTPAFTRRSLHRPLIGAAIAVTVVKLALAWMHPGFFSGDDVEVQEMSLGALLGRDAPIWSLRSAVFPLGVLYPAQWAAYRAGFADPAVLVFVGRAAVATLSSVSLWLTVIAGRRLLGNASAYAVCAALFLAVNRLHVAFGSTELPRPVATALVLAAFIMLLGGTRRGAALGGLFIGIAASFRFSEVTFLAAGGVHLALRRNWGALTAFTAAAVGAGAAVIGMSDLLYWGSPFFSLSEAVSYTLVDRASSRGYQSVGWYAIHAVEWASPFVLGLAVIGTARAPLALSLWAWGPIAVLSLLPHKEARYLVPSVPFVCLLAGYGAHALVERVRAAEARRPSLRPAALALAVVLSCLHDAGGWRLRRSDDDVALLRQLIVPRLEPGDVVAAEQFWRLGGMLYMPESAAPVEVDPAHLRDPSHMSPYRWVLIDSTTVSTLELADALGSAGFQEIAHAGASTYRVFRAPSQAGAARPMRRDSGRRME